MRWSAAVLLVGCSRAGGVALDASLPDGEVLALAAPREALDALAASPDPAVRAEALAARVRTAPPDEVPALVARGTWDPEPWVAGAVLDALATRADVPEADALRVDLVLRPSGDPVLRAVVALDRIEAGRVDGLDAVADAWTSQVGWARVPLALVAHRLGAPGAAEALVEALAAGPLPDDPALVAHLGRWAPAGAAQALARAEAEIEEAAGPASAAARALLGDPLGRAAWRAALTSRDPSLARDAADVLLALPDAVRADWLELAAGARDPAVRTLHALLSRPDPAGLLRAAGARSPAVREVAARLADRAGRPAADGVASLLLDDPEPDLRAWGARLVARHGVPIEAARLVPLRTDDRGVVRAAGQAAALALGIDDGAR